MTQKANSAELQLAPPGAGIPLPAQIFLRLFIRPFKAEKADWAESKLRFEKTTQKILREIEGLSEEQISQRVLVPPQMGLEDSSRYWSIAMTLEHLELVNRLMAQLIQALTHGIVPDAKADIAKMKPMRNLSAAESLQIFRRFSLEEFSIISIGDRNSQLRFAHPWFGKMTARAWYWLMAIHQGIHLQQIRAIKKGLNSI